MPYFTLRAWSLLGKGGRKHRISEERGALDALHFVWQLWPVHVLIELELCWPTFSSVEVEEEEPHVPTTSENERYGCAPHAAVKFNCLSQWAWTEGGGWGGVKWARREDETLMTRAPWIRNVAKLKGFSDVVLGCESNGDAWVVGQVGMQLKKGGGRKLWLFRMIRETFMGIYRWLLHLSSKFLMTWDRR